MFRFLLPFLFHQISTHYTEILTEESLHICEKDARKHLISDGDMVCVESPRGKVDIKAKITDEVKPGILSSTFHFPENMLNNITSSISDTEALPRIQSGGLYYPKE